MKYSAWLLVGLLLDASGPPLRAANVSGSTNASSIGVTYAVASRGANARRWVKIVSQTNQAGEVTFQTNKSYVELATGLCYLDQNANWVDAVEQIDIVQDGAQATQGRHTVHWMGNANTPGGAIHLVSPTGKTFDSTVYGLSYWDAATGSNILIGPLQDSHGQLVGSNRVIYPNAFQNVNADIEYLYKKSGLEQNIILRSQPPSPTNWGLNPATTRIQVLTEFFSPPAPVSKKTTAGSGVVSDAVLNFGDTIIGVGQVFYTQGVGGNRSGGLGIVSKHWTTLEGRDFLIEEVPYRIISNAVQNLPPQASVTNSTGASIKHTAALEPLLPREVASTTKSGPLQIANSVTRQPGLVIDYQTIDGDYGDSDGTTNFVFQGDTTYLVTGTAYIGCDGGVIFEGGCVIKFIDSSDASIYSAGTAAVASFPVSPYRPVVFTSADDDTVGDLYESSSHDPVQNSANYFSESGGYEACTNALQIQNARFSYAGLAYFDFLDCAFVFNDCQFRDCGTNAEISNGLNVSFQNVLSSGSGTMAVNLAEGGIPSGVVLDGENMTVDSCAAFVPTGGDWGSSGGITNSILTDCDHSITSFVLNHTVTNASGIGIFQTVGAASYYLTTGSTNRNAGTTNINLALLQDLATKTTYPPTVIIATITNNVTYSPVAVRNTGLPDLGYHYDPIDFAIINDLTNGSITVLPGTVLANIAWADPGGVFNSVYYGLWLNGSNTISFQGTPISPIFFVAYNTVQEQSNTNWPVQVSTNWHVPTYQDAYFSGSPSILGPTGNSTVSSFRFTEWATLAGGAPHFISSTGDYSAYAFRDCQFYGGSLVSFQPTLIFTNCLFQRVFIDFEDDGTMYPTFYNNLMVGGELDNDRFWVANAFTYFNNLFDQTIIDPFSPVNYCGNNAYVTNCDMLTSSLYSTDVLLTNSPAYEIGALGQNYYPTNLPLIHVGSESAADLGLYHYTVTTNNVIEGTNIVSIGFHYVATDGNGNPINTVGGFLPDYLADANGDGAYDGGDPYNWLINPYNGLTYANGLEVFTPLK